MSSLFCLPRCVQVVQWAESDTREENSGQEENVSQDWVTCLCVGCYRIPAYVDVRSFVPMQALSVNDKLMPHRTRVFNPDNYKYVFPLVNGWGHRCLFWLRLILATEGTGGWAIVVDHENSIKSYSDSIHYGVMIIWIQVMISWKLETLMRKEWILSSFSPLPLTA